MKRYNSPKQARSLREIEAIATSPVLNTIKEVKADVQPVHAVPQEEEAGTEKKAESAPKKTRSKKNTEEV